MVRTGCFSSERSLFHMHGFCKYPLQKNVGIFVRTSKPATPADARAGFQRTVKKKDRCFRVLRSAVDRLAFLFSINLCEGLKAEDRFVQVPPCSPALTSPASNDEQVNGNTFKWERSLV